MTWQSTKEAMPWVGLYIAAASLVCTLAMAADVFHGFRQRKLWFPCKFFTLNAASITLIAIAMKLPVDLSDDDNNDIWIIKVTSIFFLFTMLANFLPSLGGMDDKELFTNLIALGILIITIIVNACIQEFVSSFLVFFIVEMSMVTFFLLWPFWVALTVPASRRVLEHQYQELHKELHRSSLEHQQIKFSFMELMHHVKKYWMMSETGNPQFVLASSPFSSTSGLVCAFCTLESIVFMIQDYDLVVESESDYKWSIKLIFYMQSIGIIVGSIAPIFRCITTATYFNLSILWSINHINMFRVEKHWTQKPRQWKRMHVSSHIPGRHCKKVVNHVKNMILNFCIALQITLVVICKTICFIPTCIVLLFYSLCHFSNSLLKRFRVEPDASNNNARLEFNQYIGYVLQIEEETKLSERKLRNMLKSITKLLERSEKKQPIQLLKFLEKSIGFNGVAEFDNDHVPPLHPKETNNCWSLIAVTLTTVARALPNIENGQVKGLLASMSEGLRFVRHIEETLNANDDLVKARKTARRIWNEVEVYRSWLQFDLQKKARKGKRSKEILQWLGDEAVQIVIQFKRKKKISPDDSSHKFIAASSMYRISQTILLHCNEQAHWPTDVELFEWISTIIADLLWACFTNLPRVITLKCHHDAIEKRGESIRSAARLLGESKTILNILEGRQLPDLDMESMAYVDKWRALPKSQIPNDPTSSAGIRSASSSSNELVTITTM